MNKNKGYWYNTFGEMTWQMYIKQEPYSFGLINVINYAEIAANPKYIRIISSIQHKWKIIDMTRPKPKTTPK